MSKISHLTTEQLGLLAVHNEQLTPVLLFKLRKRFGNYERVAKSSERQLRQAGLTEPQTQGILNSKKLLDRRITVVKRLNIHILLFGDKDYPYNLRHISDPPAVLYVRGLLSNLKSISIVGTRRASSYGESVAFDLAKQAAGLNMVVVSGLAFGIDSAAHRGSLKVNGRTIAVLGGGLETIYPREHYELGMEILEKSGALVSEFPLFSPCYKSNFLIRNRIIAGLSTITVVVEAGTNSGALTTANHALKYGRDVLAVPGDITRETSLEVNRLMLNGARPYLGFEDFARYYKFELQESLPPHFTDDELRLLEQISREGAHLNDIAKALQLDIATLSSKVIVLELKGAIHHLGSGIYRRLF